MRRAHWEFPRHKRPPSVEPGVIGARASESFRVRMSYPRSGWHCNRRVSCTAEIARTRDLNSRQIKWQRWERIFIRCGPYRQGREAVPPTDDVPTICAASTTLQTWNEDIRDRRARRSDDPNHSVHHGQMPNISHFEASRLNH